METTAATSILQMEVMSKKSIILKLIVQRAEVITEDPQEIIGLVSPPARQYDHFIW